jgi:hypothetical protein
MRHTLHSSVSTFMLKVGGDIEPCMCPDSYIGEYTTSNAAQELAARIGTVLQSRPAHLH